MKTSVEHIPQERQAELKRIKDTIIQLIQPEKIILFGSYATGRQVTDIYVSGHITYEYLSDYDVLVVTSRGEKREEHHIQEMLETKCQSLTTIPINIIVHGIDYVNKRISEGQYFFTDVKKQGILLHDAGKVPLTEQKELTARERKEVAERDFNKYFDSGKNLLSSSIYNKEVLKSLNDAVFLLHQAAERLYNAMILVFTGYKSKTHNLTKLIKMSRDFSPELSTIFPNNSPDETHLLSLLRRAYVDARYNETYSITEDELNTLIERVKRLQEIAEKVCKDKIMLF